MIYVVMYTHGTQLFSVFWVFSFLANSLF